MDKYLVNVDGKQRGYFGQIEAYEQAKELFKNHKIVEVAMETESGDVVLWSNGHFSCDLCTKGCAPH